MRNPLNKSLKKEFKNNLARYLSISIVMIVMIAAVSGFLTVAYGSKQLLEENQVECKVEDGQFALANPIHPDTKDALESLPLSVYEQFYSEQEISDDTSIRVYRNRSEVNLATLSEGSLPVNANEIALDRLFAVKNDLHIHDMITLGEHDYMITGLISVPDYSSLIKKNSDLMMDPIHFGIGIVNDQSFEKLYRQNIVYSYSYQLDQNEISDKEAYDLLMDIKEILLTNNEQIETLMTTQMNQAISFLPNDMGSDIPMIKALLYIIMVILAFIFVVISQAIIEDQSMVIGTLLASGYTKFELIQHYMILPALLILTSAVIGNILGYMIFPPLFSSMYYNSYCLPPFETRFIMEAFVSTTILPFIFMMLIQFLKLYHIMRISPLRFLRHDLHKQKSRRYIHLKDRAFFQRFRIRVILQNKGSYLTLFVGIIFASFLFLFGIVMTPSMDHYIKESENSIKAEYQYLLKAPVEADGEKITVTSLNTYYPAGDMDLDVTFYGLQENSQYFTDIRLSSRPDDIVVSSDFAQKMSLDQGDTLIFQNSNTDQVYTFHISDIYEYRAGFSAFLSKEQLNEILNQDESWFNGYLSNKPLDINEKLIQTTITRNDVIKIGEQVTQVFSAMIPIMVSVSIVIFLIVIYILTKLVIDRNAIHMSFLKVMGYNSKEIKRLYLHATTIVVFVSLLVSLPICATGLHYLMIFVFMKFSTYLEAFLPWYAFLLVFLTGLIAYLIIYFILTKRIEHIHLGKALKEDE